MVNPRDIAGEREKKYNTRDGLFKGRHGSGNKSSFDSGDSKSKVCSYILKHRGDTVVETKAALTVVIARVKCVLIYSNIEETR